jgi:hypothetical protein
LQSVLSAAAVVVLAAWAGPPFCDTPKKPKLLKE